MEPRKAARRRETKETQLDISINLDGSGSFSGEVGVPFLEHMLDLFTRHGLFDIQIKGQGDVQIDPHHTTEDLGIVLGECFSEALGDKKGITRFGAATVPMDESLARVAVDLCNRPYLVWNVDLDPKERIGDFEAELGEEFWRAFAMNARLTMHMELFYGSNSHHKLEALFKAAGRALAEAIRLDPRVKDVPSTKGTL